MQISFLLAERGKNEFPIIAKSRGRHFRPFSMTFFNYLTYHGIFLNFTSKLPLKHFSDVSGFGWLVIIIDTILHV